MQDFYEPKNSKYCYENSDVLINYFNVRDNEILSNLESVATAMRSLQLRDKGITGNFDVEHFTSIHKDLFDRIYPFAGLFRTENISKDNFRFAEWQYIEEEIRKLLIKLKNENILDGLLMEDLSERLAYYVAELNVLHPFRERKSGELLENL